MAEELKKIADEYLDRFITSDLVMVKITDENYPINSLKNMLISRIRKRGMTNITAYTFLNELFLEKI